MRNLQTPLSGKNNSPSFSGTGFFIRWKPPQAALFAAIAAMLALAAPCHALTLQILHASDLEAGIPALDDAPRFSSVLEGLKSAHPSNTLVLSSGDNYISGPFMNASADPSAGFNGTKGRGDVLILNALGVQAAAFGNHEFDDDTALVRALLRPDPSIAPPYPGTAFPYLSANLDFAGDGNLNGQVAPDGQNAASLSNRIAKSCTLHVAGATVGIVGATTPDLATLTNPGNVAVLTNVAAEVQAAVDALSAAGVDLIVLLSHLQQVENEIELATRLRNVDVVVAGGSHAIMAKPSDRLRTGDVRYGDYPVVASDLDGHPVYVLNAGANYRYVGRFVADVDDTGAIVAVHPSSGAYATDVQGVADSGNHPPNPAVTNVVGILSRIIDAKDGNLFGRTAVYLNGIRQSIRTEETNLGNLTAVANLFRARQTDPNTSISLKNAGGIRDSIGAILPSGGNPVRVPPLANPRVGKQDGDVSQLDIENALRFNNALALVTLTARQLRDAMEWSVSGSGTPGQFPQVAGLRLSFDPAREPMTYVYASNGAPAEIDFPGERVRSLVAIRADGQQDLVVENGQLVGDSNRTFRMVTFSFMLDGGDRFFPLTLGTERLDFIPTGAPRDFAADGGEQKALADYLLVAGEWIFPDNDPSFDDRIQRLDVRSDGVLNPRLASIEGYGQTVLLSFGTLPGKRYALSSAAGLANPWPPLDSPAWILGDGYDKTNAIPIGDSRRFFRIVMEPAPGKRQR